MFELIIISQDSKKTVPYTKGLEIAREEKGYVIYGSEKAEIGLYQNLEDARKAFNGAVEAYQKLCEIIVKNIGGPWSSELNVTYKLP